MKSIDRLAKHLEDAGYCVDSIIVSKGIWTHVTHDCMRWTARVVVPGETHFSTIGSWDNVKLCARGGFTFSEARNSMSGYREVHARPIRRRKAI